MFALTLSVASLAAFDAAGAQAAKKLFFEGDIVRGDQEGAPGPCCVLNSQFKRLEKVVWRLRILDQAGKALDDKGLEEPRCRIARRPEARRRGLAHIRRPSQGRATDHFWTARWIIPTEYPSGTFDYKVVATDLDGNSQTWEPFKRGALATGRCRRRNRNQET